MRQQLMITALGLLAASGLCYGVTLRAWLSCLRSPQVAGLSAAQRDEFIASPEYRKLRAAVRRPIYAATVLVIVLYALLRLPF